MPQVIKLGTNALIERDLLQADGTTPLNYSALTYAAVQLWQGDTLVKTLVAGTDPELRQGSTGTKILLELTEAIRAQLSSGVQLRLEWLTDVADALFVVDSATHKASDADASIDLFDLE